ncbi:hypothetical protein CQ13_38410 [Bradyrhizobium retamae]|uniref:Beta-lactamase-related domain-containing protein n=2 Tax=Bradyrhizobium retamae TaxID=1300035 RepID=A0A0R3NBW3_9BRAD|nr:hypothetical protein CQ13_38410 [Bradyrhizobium retamae]
MIVGTTEAKNHTIVPYGRCDISTGKVINERTIFEIGSVTKLFTALLLSDMVNRGEVKLEEPVVDLLPAGTRVPVRNGRAITLRDLASHYSGLPRLPTNFAPKDPKDPYADYTENELYQFLETYELVRTPGDTFEYSNLGVGLLGHALVLRAGCADYESLVRSRILAPLRMDDTFVRIPPGFLGSVATGHDDNLDPVPNWNLDVLAGAGGLRSNLSDLLLFMDALCDPEQTSIGSMISPLVKPLSQGGLGLLPTPHYDGPTSISHAGGTGGFSSFVGCIPEWKRGIVCLSNSGIPAIADLAVHVLDPRWGMHWYRKEADVDPSQFARLLGRYRLGPNHVFQVTSTADRLYVQLTGQQALRAFPASEWHFFYKAVGAQITFEPDAGGRAARLILHQNSCDQIADRIE